MALVRLVVANPAKPFFHGMHVLTKCANEWRPTLADGGIEQSRTLSEAILEFVCGY